MPIFPLKKKVPELHCPGKHQTSSLHPENQWKDGRLLIGLKSLYIITFSPPNISHLLHSFTYITIIGVLIMGVGGRQYRRGGRGGRMETFSFTSGVFFTSE